MLPNFLILGAAKCGTSALNHYLDQNPQILTAQPKETPFFSAEYEKGMDYYEKTYFSHWDGEPFVGDAAHRNLFLSYVPQRISESLENPKLIVIVRDPVDRAYSHYWDDYTHGVLKTTFEDCLKLDFEQIRSGPRFQNANEYCAALNATGHTPAHPTLLDSGHYAEQINRYWDVFGRESMRILQFEDLISDTESVVEQMYLFIGADALKVTDLRPQNQAASKGLATLFEKVGQLPLMDRIPYSWRTKVKMSMRRTFARPKPPMKPETRQWLKNYYRPHIEKLESMIGKDLSGWH